MSLVRSNASLQQILKTKNEYPLIGIINVETHEIFFASYLEGTIVDPTNVYWSQHPNSVIDAINKKEIPNYDIAYDKGAAQKFLDLIQKNNFIPSIEITSTGIKTATEILLEQSSTTPDKNQWIAFEATKSGLWGITFPKQDNYLSLKKQTPEEQETLTSVLRKKFNPQSLDELQAVLAAIELQKLNEPSSEKFTTRDFVEEFNKKTSQFNNQTQELKMPQAEKRLENKAAPLNVSSIQAPTETFSVPPRNQMTLEIPEVKDAITQNLITTQEIQNLPEFIADCIFSTGGKYLLSKNPAFILIMLKLTKNQASILSKPDAAQKIVSMDTDLSEFLKVRERPYTALQLIETLNFKINDKIKTIDYDSTSATFPEPYEIELSEEEEEDNSQLALIETIAKAKEIIDQEIQFSAAYTRSNEPTSESKISENTDKQLHYSNGKAAAKQTDPVINNDEINEIKKQLLPEAQDTSSPLIAPKAAVEPVMPRGIQRLIIGKLLTREQLIALNKDQANILGDDAIAQKIIDDGKDLTEFLKTRAEPLDVRQLGKTLGYTFQITGYTSGKPDSYLIVEPQSQVSKPELKATESESKEPAPTTQVNEEDYTKHPEKKLLSEFNKLVKAEGDKLTIESMENFYSEFKKNLLKSHSPSVQYTRSYKNAVEKIRHSAFDKLKNQILANNEMSKDAQGKDLTPKDKNDMAEILLLKAKSMVIFNTHRSQYWFTGARGNTGAVDAIDVMLKNLETAKTQGRTLGQK